MSRFRCAALLAAVVLTAHAAVAQSSEVGAGAPDREDGRGDTVKLLNAPMTVSRAGTYPIQVEYFCAAPRHMTINFLRPLNGYAWHGGKHVLLTPGGGTITLDVTLQNDPPPGEKEYTWHLFMSELEDDWENATANDRVEGVTVTGEWTGPAPEPAKRAEADGIRITSCPKVLRPGFTYSVVVKYVRQLGAQAEYAGVQLLDRTRRWALYGAGREALPNGRENGLLTVRLSVEKSAPLGDDYVLNAFIAPEGKDWNEATASSLQNIRIDDGNF